MYGFTGRIADIDLGRNVSSIYSLSEEIYHDYLGGTGLAAHILTQEIKPGTDPLSEENVFAVMTGCITGSVIPGSGRVEVCSLSPLTGAWGESSIGGFWGRTLKVIGYDGVLVRGKAENPKYILIDNDAIRVIDAEWLWGKTTYETERLIKEKHGKQSQVLSIGPAGENLVPMAGISHNRSNMAARCGLGAVLGSKNIKAIVVTGQGQIPVYDPQAVKKDREEIVSLINANPVLGILKNGGTAWGLDWLMGVGDTPVKNWEIDSRSEMELCSKINGQAMEGAGLVVGRQNCFMCPIACKRFSKLPDEPSEENGTVPEYESLGALGTMVIVEDKESIIKANDLCNMYGMDTISVGGTIAWVIDAFQNGLITKEDTFGLELKWGDGELVNTLIRQIAYRKDFGAILAFGSRKAAEILGKGTEQMTVQVKGLELPMHDPKINPGWGVVYATGSRGASHNETGSIALSNDPNKQAELIKTSVDRKLFESAINICSYVASPISDEFLVKIIFDITGYVFSIENIYETGSRIWNQRRIFNAKICNISGKEDTLPKKVMNSNYTEEEFQQSLAAYYRVRDLSSLGEIALPLSNTEI